MEVPLSDEAIDFLEEQIPELAEIALKQAYWQVLASGHSVLQAEDGALYRVFPDGKREFVKKLEPKVPVTQGKKILIK